MPPPRAKPAGYKRARDLRKTPTKAEKILWTHLRAHRLAGAGFRRQHAIGPYIADFCSPRWKIVIELDGGHHTHQKEYDSIRTAYLNQKGYFVLRFWNHEVIENPEGVLQTIAEKMLTVFEDR
jgi:very-short-patch-repair endonuclease